MRPTTTRRQAARPLATRKRRMQRAEESAQKAGPRMTVLLILFVLPALLLILVGPAAINIKNALGPALANPAGAR